MAPIKLSLFSGTVPCREDDIADCRVTDDSPAVYTQFRIKKNLCCEEGGCYLLKKLCIALCIGLVCRGPWLNSVLIGFYFILFSRGGRRRVFDS